MAKTICINLYIDAVGAGFVLLCATNSLAERPSVTDSASCFAHWQVAASGCKGESLDQCDSHPVSQAPDDDEAPGAEEVTCDPLV